MSLLSNQTSAQYYGNSDLYGEYQFVSLTDIIDQFMFIYVGEDKIISKASRVDVAFHAQRGLAEMSFDTFKSTKALEIVVPSTLQMILPQDYVNYVKLSWVDNSGIMHILYPASKTSNPTKPTQDSDGNYTFNGSDGTLLTDSQSTTWTDYKSSIPSENENDDYKDDIYWPIDGNRYGLDPQHAQVNGSFYIDENAGKIHFSSNINGKTVILNYISDSLGTEDEMKVHKFAEEAMYKWISCAIISGKSNIPEYQVNRFKKEKFAAVRTAKLRLSNLKLEELTQILRGKSKHIKH
jgi:hypothetical protein|tara:strand:+ start:1747 stop:2628 length:882 start_codon:yes stop_codon:yes gene_type:complete